MKRLIVFTAIILLSVTFLNAEKRVALTFDDGPWSHTKDILNILDEHEIKATFFVIGKHIEMYPSALKEVVKRGHVIGNHTYNHYDLTTLSAEQIREEIEKTEKLIDSICPDACSNFLKPPAFHIDRASALVISKMGYRLVFTTVDPVDWDTKNITTELIIIRVLDGLSPTERDEEIITLHDGGGNRERTVQALPDIIKGLKEQEYEFVTITELFQE